MRRVHCRPMYDNCLVLGPDGLPMFRCNLKRINWYLKRNLGEIVNQDPLTLKLNFSPNGPGHRHDPFCLQHRQSLCCVCGHDKNLTSHHVVPVEYRRHMSNKCHNYHDILPLCRPCHNQYNLHMDAARQELSVLHDAPLGGRVSGISNCDFQHMAKLCNVLVKYSIPESRRIAIISRIAEILGRLPSEEDVLRYGQTPLKRDLRRQWQHFDDDHSHGELVVRKVDHDEFAVWWRKHFVDTMNPQHLPSGWDINKRYDPS